MPTNPIGTGTITEVSPTPFTSFPVDTNISLKSKANVELFKNTPASLIQIRGKLQSTNMHTGAGHGDRIKTLMNNSDGG
jgi:hypothetical protein